MAVTVDTITTQNIAAPRSTAFDSTGRWWIAVYSNGDSRFEFWYSDNETTWTEATSLRIGSYTGAGNCALAINTISDRAVFYLDATENARVCVGIDESSTWTTITGTGFGNFDAGSAAMDVVTFNKPGSSNYYIAGTGLLTGTGAILTVYEVTSSHTVTATPINASTIGPNYINSTSAVDFRHTGDGSTVASSSPDIFTFTGPDDAAFYKFPWNGSGWDAGSYTLIDITADTSHPVSAVFDGAYFVMAYTFGSALEVWQRDAADTTSSDLSVPTLGESPQGVSVTHDQNGNIYVVSSGQTTDDIEYVVYDRSGASWGSWTTLEATTAIGYTLAVTKHPSHSRAGVVWQESGVNVKAEAISWVVPITPSPILCTTGVVEGRP